MIHRAGRRHADVPIAKAAGPCLHCGLRARRDDLDGGGAIIELLQRPCGDLAFGELRSSREPEQVVAIGLDAREFGAAQRGLEPGQCVGAIAARHDQLGDHRVVEGRDFRAALDPGLDPGALGKPDLGQQTRARAEIAARILRIEPDLDRMALGLGPFERQGLASRLPQHPFDEVDTGYLLGDAVLDLEAGVHFEKIELAAVDVVQKLDGAGVLVIDRRAEALGGRQQIGARLVRDVRRGCLLDHLLVPALRGAIAFAEREHLALAVAEDLHLDVAAAGDELFEEDARILEIVRREPLHAFEHRHDFLRRTAELQADAAAARGALDHHRIADPLSLVARRLGGRDQAAARRERHACLLGDLAGLMLQAEGPHVLGSRANESDTGLGAGLGKVRVLRQEAVAGMDRLRPGFFRHFENAGGVEITLRCRRRADADRFGCHLHMQRMAVRLRIDGDGRDPHAVERADDAARDGAAICNQYFLEHLAPHAASQITTSIGVGL